MGHQIAYSDIVDGIVDAKNRYDDDQDLDEIDVHTERIIWLAPPETLSVGTTEIAAGHATELPAGIETCNRPMATLHGTRYVTLYHCVYQFATVYMYPIWLHSMYPVVLYGHAALFLAIPVVLPCFAKIQFAFACHE